MDCLKTNFRVVIWGILVMCVCLQSCNSDNEEQDKTDLINLALRQVGDRLYKACGDDFSLIPPVDKINKNEYQLKLANGLDYEMLPAILDKAMTDFGVSDLYVVTVLDCLDKNIILGYNNYPNQLDEVACRTREQVAQCNILNLEISGTVRESEQGTPYILIGLLAFLGYFFYQSRKKRPVEEMPKKIVNKEQVILKKADVETGLKIGNSIFDPQALIITHEEEVKNLTYREAKLFEYFVDHKNEVLKRDDIQTHVWEDEGVIVGRSLDVFISRLRKIIKSDNSLSIKNIHGVGYRLEEIG